MMHFRLVLLAYEQGIGVRKWGACLLWKLVAGTVFACDVMSWTAPAPA